MFSFYVYAIPNRDFNDDTNAFPNDVSAQDISYQVSATPMVAAEKTVLSLQIDNAILLKGVKANIIAAARFGVGGGKTGFNDITKPRRKGSMFAANNFSDDTHHAHAQGDSHYHYYGTQCLV